MVEALAPNADPSLALLPPLKREAPQDLARIIRQAVKASVVAAVKKTRTTGVLSGTVEQIDSEDLDIAFIRMDNEAISGDPTESQNYEMPGVIPATRRGQTFDGDQVRLDFSGPFGADAMQVGVQKRIVLPYGAEGGPRVIIEGDDGSILVYDASGDLYGSVTPAGGFQVFNPSTADERIALDILGGLPTLSLATGDADESAAGRIIGVVSGTGGARNLTVDIATGEFAGDRGRIVLRSESEGGTEPSRVHIDASELELNAPIVQTITDTTDASGFITFNHGSPGTTPKAVIVTHQAPLSGPAAFLSGVDSIGSTTARGRWLQVSAGTVVSHASASATFRVLTIV